MPRPIGSSIGSTAGANSSTPSAHRVVDHQLDELLDGFPGSVRRSEGLHCPRADVVVHRAHELVTVGKALVEVAFGQRSLAADGANRQRRPVFAASNCTPAAMRLSRRRA